MSHARIFTTRLPVLFVSRVQEISAERKKNEEAKRRGKAKRERKKETGLKLFNRELDSMTQVRAILVPFTNMVLLYFFLSFLSVSFFSSSFFLNFTKC